MATLPATLNETARAYAREARAPSTRIAYAADLRHFSAWCREHDARFLPALSESVAAYLADHAETFSPATLERRLAAIRFIHQARGVPSPVDETVRAVLAGIRRLRGAAPVQKAPLTVDSVKLMIDAINKELAHVSDAQHFADGLFRPQLNSALGSRGATGKTSDCRDSLRDKAIIAVGFSAALRRSEITQLRVEDLERTPRGLLVHIRKSKTDQDGSAAQAVAIPASNSPYSAIAALDAWLSAAGIATGLIFDIPACDVRKIVMRWAAAAGIDPKTVSAHSLRSGAITTGAMRGASWAKLAELSRHKSLSSLKQYVRITDSFLNHALEGDL